MSREHACIQPDIQFEDSSSNFRTFLALVSVCFDKFFRLRRDNSEIIRMLTRTRSMRSIPDVEAKENFKTPTKPKRTTKAKRKSPENSSNEESPTKSSRSSSSISPIADRMRKDLHITSEKNKFRSARRALVENQNYSLPGREKEWDELTEYLDEHIGEEMSGSLYMSGAPGTGELN